MTHTCAVRNCGGTLQVDETLKQDDTGLIGQKVRCDRNPGHRYFLVGDRPPSSFNRLIDDTRWRRNKPQRELNYGG